jgi:hypothetical protein
MTQIFIHTVTVALEVHPVAEQDITQILDARLLAEHGVRAEEAQAQ